jgi:hypothetical protein
LNIAAIWIYLNSIFYIGLGIFTLFKPQSVAAVVGYQLTTAGAIAELKACYGGLMISLGAIMWLLLTKYSANLSLGFIAIIYLGFGAGRLVGIIGDRAFDSTSLSFSAVEIGSFIISVCLYRLYLAPQP